MSSCLDAQVDAPTKATSQPHDDWPRIGSADDGRPESLQRGAALEASQVGQRRVT